MSRNPSIFSELGRRKVLRAGGLYLLAAIAALEGASILFDTLQLPPLALRVLVALALLGLPVTLALAWLVEHGPDGLRWAAPAPGPRPHRIRAYASLFVLAVSVLSGLAAWNVYIAPVPVATMAGVTSPSASPSASRLLVELALSSSTKSADFHYYHAHALLELGRTEGALDALNRYVALDPAKGVYLTADWWFRKVHDHPRFRAMIGNQGD